MTDAGNWFIRFSKSIRISGILGGKYNEQTYMALGRGTIIATVCKGVVNGYDTVWGSAQNQYHNNIVSHFGICAFVMYYVVSERDVIIRFNFGFL